MLVYWIWFAQLKGLTCQQKHLLLQHFPDPEELYHSDSDLIARSAGITEQMLEALEERSLAPAQKILADCADKGIGILTWADEHYPGKLKNTFEPPLVLYYRGKLPKWEEQPLIGVVGTRKASAYGMRAAYRYGSQIAACGGIVVSGGALGVDTMALEGALQTGAAVVCVFGCGVDVYYPSRNKDLFTQVLTQGCILSEYPPRTEAYSWNFPRRNRILSGISNGVLVVEAPMKSGALITARWAMEQGREVFAVPGNVDVDTCAGSNALLQDYGIAALSGWDVMKEYRSRYPDKVIKGKALEPPEPATVQVAQSARIPQKIPAARENADKKSIDKDKNTTYSVVDRSGATLSREEQSILDRIGAEPMLIDELITASGLPAGRLKGLLTKLMVKGQLQNHPGGRVSRK